MSIPDSLVGISGQAHQILTRVANGSLHPERTKGDLQAIIEGKTRQVDDLINGLFVPPEQQLMNIKRWNKVWAWGITPRVIEEAEAAMSDVVWPSATDRFAVVVLVPYLETIELTVDGLWAAAASQQRRSSDWRTRRADDLAEDKVIQPIKSIAHIPGLRWEVIDLGASRDKLQASNLATAGVLAAAAHFPKWVQSMGYDRVAEQHRLPYACLGGYRTGPGGRSVLQIQYVEETGAIILAVQWLAGQQVEGSSFPVIRQ